MGRAGLIGAVACLVGGCLSSPPGLAIDDLDIDDVGTPDWGAYRSDHGYEVEFIGRGAPINAQFHDSDCADNTGVIELTIVGLPG